MKKLIVAVTMVLALGIMMLPIMAQAAVMTNIKQPVSVTIWNPCSSEWIQMQGSVHILVAITIDSRGGIHMKSHTNAKCSGVGLISGAKYELNSVSNSHTNINPGTFPRVYTSVNDLKLIGQGKAPDYTVRMTFHMTINENGVVTANRFTFKVICK